MKNKYLIILNMILLSFVLATTQHKALTDSYYVNNDVRYLFYINNFQDNLENNLPAQYSYTKGPATIYLSSIYVAFNNFIDFILFSKILNIFAFLASVIFLFKLGNTIKNQRYALILVFLFILFAWTKTQFDGGLSRAFAYPLLIAFLYYSINENIAKLSIVTILQAILYPPILLISLGTYGLLLINFKEKRIDLKIRKNSLFYLSVAVSFILILIPIYFMDYGIKERISFSEAISYPEYYLDGRYPTFRGTIPLTADLPSTIKSAVSFYNIGVRRPIITDTIFILLLLSGIFILIYQKKLLKLPREIFYMATSSFLLLIIATLTFSLLYFPSRYIKFTIPIFLIFLTANGLYFLSIRKKAKYLFPAFLIILILLFLPQVDSGLMHCGDNELYSFIKKLPEETLIAGHPSDMDCIALYGQKKPFITYETSFPLFTDYYHIIKQRTFKFFSAYYAEGKQTIQDFCKENKITHLVVNKEHFTTDYLKKERFYFKPFNDFIKNLTKQGHDFYLMQPEKIIFESGDKFIVECS